MLAVSDAMRAVLFAAGVLQVDEDGHDALIGLTAAESQFFVTFGCLPIYQREPAESMVYAQLRLRHLKAKRGGTLIQ